MGNYFWRVSTEDYFATLDSIDSVISSKDSPLTPVLDDCFVSRCISSSRSELQETMQENALLMGELRENTEKTGSKTGLFSGCEIEQQSIISGRREQRCLVCPVQGGSFVQLNSAVIENVDIDLFSGVNVYLHTSCAMAIEKNANENVCLTKIQRENFRQICSICKTSHGACVKCARENCAIIFHPGCLDKAISSHDPFVYYCRGHQLKRLRVEKEKTLMDIVRSSSKLFEIKDTDRNRDKFTPNEDRTLLFSVLRLLHDINCSQEEPFCIYIDTQNLARKSAIQVQRPKMYNLVAPQVILEYQVAIDDRSVFECFRRYSEFLQFKIRNDLKSQKKQAVEFKGSYLSKDTVKQFIKDKKGKGRRPYKKKKLV